MDSAPAVTRPGPVPGRPCSMAAALQLVGERWSLLVVRELLLGNRRFDRIARNTGAPRDVLTARLRSLEAAGIVTRSRYSDRPPRYEYGLTRPGLELGDVVRSLLAWGDRWAVERPPIRIWHRDHPLERVVRCSTCGEPIQEEDLAVEALPAEPGREGRQRSTPTT